MREPQHRICRLADEAAATSEPHEALRKLRALREELEEFERSRVVDALRAGSSFGAIAKSMGVSRQAAHRRYRDLAPAATEAMPLSSHARRAVHLARDEATSAGARRVESAHLLIGVLRSGGAASRALEAGGVTADAARGCLPGEHKDEDGGGARAVLAEAAEIAQARHARYVEAEHIALAALKSSDGGALQAVTALGVPAAEVRERLAC